jgi:hypothetical protein
MGNTYRNPEKYPEKRGFVSFEALKTARYSADYRGVTIQEKLQCTPV